MQGWLGRNEVSGHTHKILHSQCFQIKKKVEMSLLPDDKIYLSQIVSV